MEAVGRDGARQMVESGTTAAADIVTDLDAAGALASQGHAQHRLLGGNGWHNAEWMEKGRTELIRQLRRMNEEQLPTSASARMLRIRWSPNRSLIFQTLLVS